MNLLIISTLICILNEVIPFLIDFILSRKYANKKYDRELWDELSNLKREMAEISMVNEFAKYARLQRKYNNVQSIFKNNRKQRQSQRMKLQLSLTHIFYIMKGILVFILLHKYNNVLVINLPEDTLWPIQGLLSWPTQHKDGISLIIWLVITRSVLSSYRNPHELFGDCLV